MIDDAIPNTHGAPLPTHTTPPDQARASPDHGCDRKPELIALELHLVDVRVRAFGASLKYAMKFNDAESMRWCGGSDTPIPGFVAHHETLESQKAPRVQSVPRVARRIRESIPLRGDAQPALRGSSGPARSVRARACVRTIIAWHVRARRAARARVRRPCASPQRARSPTWPPHAVACAGTSTGAAPLVSSTLSPSSRASALAARVPAPLPPSCAVLAGASPSLLPPMRSSSGSSGSSASIAELFTSTRARGARRAPFRLAPTRAFVFFGMRCGYLCENSGEFGATC